MEPEYHWPGKWTNIGAENKGGTGIRGRSGQTATGCSSASKARSGRGRLYSNKKTQKRIKQNPNPDKKNTPNKSMFL